MAHHHFLTFLLMLAFLIHNLMRLIYLLNLSKNGEDSREFYTKLLLERFEYDIKDKLEEIKRQQKELEDNLELLEYVKKELKEMK